MIWARVHGTADRLIGIKLEAEQECNRVISHRRVSIRFRDDCLPALGEKAKLKSEGFKFCPDVQA